MGAINQYLFIGMRSMNTLIQSATQFAQSHKEIFLQDLITFTSIASISTDPNRKDEIQTAAQWMKNKLESLGLEKIKVYQTEGHPIVYGEWLKAGANNPTVLVYGHYDVQPAEPLDKWSSNPFKPDIRNDEIYARGASDMKGQIEAVTNAVGSIQAVGKFPVNIKFLIEGEEEIGSPNLAPFIENNKQQLICDVVLNTDTGMISPTLPTITYALRGLAYFEIQVKGPKQDLHSGVFGGTIHNPAQALTELVAGMHDKDGRVTLPGFYDNVRSLTEEEREEINRLPRNEAWYLTQTGAPSLWGEPEFTPDERVGGRPTLEVHGLNAGFTGKGAKTVLPAYAIAKLSCRLVPDQDPKQVHQQLIQYCKTNAPDSVRCNVEYIAGGYPSISNRNSPWIQTYFQAAESVWGVKPVFKREGGSVPVVSDFKSILGVESVNIGFGLPSDNMHGPNEKLHLPTWYRGIDTLINFFIRLAEL
jgi:acetylornithine deacetylase/succinyl-diaminopimelate desuccinylase-like protein